jgi:chemotaxis protein CheX
MVTTESLKDIVLDAAKEVFESMVFTSLEESSDTAARNNAAFLASITFRGGVEGCLTVRCDPGGARAIAAGMLCSETPENLTNGEIIDALGEIANMVMGGVKTRLQDEIRDIAISIPSVLQGRQLQPHIGEGTSNIAIPVTIGRQHPTQLQLLYRQHTS